jgi:hypothetical protein
MNRSHSNPFLRRVLKLQAGAEMALGAVALIESGWLASTLQLPQWLLLASGGMALLFGAFIYYVASRPNLATGAVWTIIGINAVWAIDCVIALAGGWLETNALGSTFIIAEAVVAAVLAEVQLIALKRTRGSAAVAA